uniref:Uncharacterized protein n=1 Tax=Fagus sylvatica TaxID=28930 RepID=A0A2N9HVC7_FAGSY
MTPGVPPERADSYLSTGKSRDPLSTGKSRVMEIRRRAVPPRIFAAEPISAADCSPPSLIALLGVNR